MTIASVLRRLLVIIFILGSIGTGVELLLAEHTENYWQWTPLGLIALSFVTLIFHALFRNATGLKIFQIMMLLFILNGCIGIWLHSQARAEFELEANPGLRGPSLLWETINGATLAPLLAPGVMIQMGLLGLAYTFRHPLLVNQSQRTVTVEH